MITVPIRDETADTESSAPILAIEGLHISTEDRPLVHDATISVAAGQAAGLVGESGSGKTLTVRAVAGLLPETFSVGGHIRLLGTDLFDDAGDRPDDAVLTRLRANEVGMVFQTPRAHLNPLRTIGDFLIEGLVSVHGVMRRQATARAVELLEEVGIDHPVRRLRQFPGELSGGLLQRVMIAAALMTDPKLLLADEITTALDVTTQEEVMAVIGDLRRHRNLGMLFITHDLALAGAVCDTVTVMEKGRTIESLEATTMRDYARTEYTKTLLAATVDDGPMTAPHAGADRGQPLLSVAGLRKTFQVRRARGGGREAFTAVNGIDLNLTGGGSLGIVGESGSGKSTTARIICGLERADSGTIRAAGQDWSRPPRGGRHRRQRAETVQMVFQDPYQSLDPRQTIRACLTEALTVHRRSMSRQAVGERIDELMRQVRLDEELIDRRPRALSGGQRQRVAIARALCADPDILVLDEAVSALDRTTQVEILTLLDSIRRERGVALLMITHDLTIVRRLCDHVIVMRAGAVEESGTSEQIIDAPRSDYTKQLIDSIPRLGWTPRRRAGVSPLGSGDDGTPVDTGVPTARPDGVGGPNESGR